MKMILSIPNTISMMMSVKRSIIPETDSNGVKNSCIYKIIDCKDKGLIEKKRPANGGTFLYYYLPAGLYPPGPSGSRFRVLLDVSPAAAGALGLVVS